MKKTPYKRHKLSLTMSDSEAPEAPTTISSAIKRKYEDLLSENLQAKLDSKEVKLKEATHSYERMLAGMESDAEKVLKDESLKMKSKMDKYTTKMDRLKDIVGKTPPPHTLTP